MKKSFLYLTIVLLFCIALWQNNAQAQCQYVQPDGVTIDPDAVLLEVVGGNLFAGCDPAPNSDTPLTTHDSWIYLVQGDTTNLHVALIDQNTLEAQFSSFPVAEFAFAFADRSINTADGGLGTCFITDGLPGGGDLTFAHSLNGLDYQLIQINTVDQYDSCTIINRCTTSDSLNTCCDDLAVVAHNVTDSTIDEYRSNNGGMDWTDEGTLVNDACGPLDGCVVPNATNNGQGAYNVFYGADDGFGGFVINVVNTTTGTIQQVAEDAINATVLKESCAVRRGFFSALYYYNSTTGRLEALDFEDSLEEISSATFPAPDFNGPGQQGFFGIGCNRFPQGEGNPEGFDYGFTYPGGNTYNGLQDDREPLATTGTRYLQAFRDPTSTTDSGPVATTWINNECGPLCVGTQGVHQIGNAAAFSNTFEYAQCIFTDSTGIPTLSEWGLIAMAGVLGLVGFMVMRRRKAAA